MSASFLGAADVRGADLQLGTAISKQLVHTGDEVLWRIARDAAVGRRLVAAKDIPAGTLVFQERALVVAETASAPAGLQFGPMPVAAALLRAQRVVVPQLLREGAQSLGARHVAVR